MQWRANRYPGCACDVQSVMYCYSFEPYPWTQHYSEQEEILQYLHHCAGQELVGEGEGGGKGAGRMMAWPVEAAPSACHSACQR